MKDSAPRTPLVFILSPGVDPTSALLQLAEHTGMAQQLHALSLGQGQAPIAARLLRGVIQGQCLPSSSAPNHGPWPNCPPAPTCHPTVCSSCSSESLGGWHLSTWTLPLNWPLMEDSGGGQRGHGGGSHHQHLLPGHWVFLLNCHLSLCPGC